MNSEIDQEVLKTIFKDELNSKDILLSKLDFQLTSALQEASALKNSKVAKVVNTIRQIIDAIAATFKEVAYYLN